MISKKRTLQFLSVVWACVFAAGVFGIAQKFMTGERLAGYGSYVPWGLWVAIYFHGVGIAGGVFAVGALGYLFGVPGLRNTLRQTILVSAVSLAMGLFAIWLDLGQPSRAHTILLRPNFGSMMAFNAWIYLLFLVAMGVAFILSLRKKSEKNINDPSGWLVPILLAGTFMSIAFPSQSGAFFGVVDAKPYWSSAMMPVLFLCSAIASGSAALLLVQTFLLPENLDPSAQPLKLLRRICIGAVIVYLGAEFAEFSVTYWMPFSQHRPSFDLMLFGPFWWVFWYVHLGGALAALFLLFRGHHMPSVGTGAFLVAFTFVTTRLNILIPGQAVSELKGLQEAFSHPRLSHYYQATSNEYLVALFIGALGTGLIVVGFWVLNRFFLRKA